MSGCIDNGIDKIETLEHVAYKLLAAVKYIPAEQIQAAPDCGLVPLSIYITRAKLRAMVEGAQLARERLGQHAPIFNSSKLYFPRPAARGADR